MSRLSLPAKFTVTEGPLTGVMLNVGPRSMSAHGGSQVWTRPLGPVYSIGWNLITKTALKAEYPTTSPVWTFLRSCGIRR